MKILFQLAIIIVISNSLYAQYFSTEEKEYYAQHHFSEFKPIDEKRILSFESFGILIRGIGKFTPFKNTYDISPSQKEASEPTAKELFTDSIDNYFIIKKEENKNVRIIVFKSFKYDADNWGEAGIWIAIVNKIEHTTKQYYTGLNWLNPLYLKWDSKIPLIKNDSTIQIEAALLQKISPAVLPAKGNDYKLIKDALLVEFNLNKIKQDSDEDGLTDIEENAMMLNPFDKDTDHDGIADNIDVNPRFASNRTEKTNIYETIISDRLHKNIQPNIFDKSFIKIALRFCITDSLLRADSIKAVIKHNLTTETIFIVSDVPDILGIQFCNKRVVIFSTSEFENYKKIKMFTPAIYSISPLFKVDNEVDTYVLNVSYNISSRKYLIKKTNKGWELDILISSII